MVGAAVAPLRACRHTYTRHMRSPQKVPGPGGGTASAHGGGVFCYFRAAYDPAVEERAHAQAEQILDIADDDTRDVIERKGKDGATHPVQNTAWRRRYPSDMGT
jgi:hypothetical protein